MMAEISIYVAPGLPNVVRKKVAYIGRKAAYARKRTLKEAAEQSFGADLSDGTKQTGNSLAKHAWRYILYTELEKSPEEIAGETGCTRPNVLHSIRTASNLMDTDREFYTKIRELAFELRNGMIISKKSLIDEVCREFEATKKDILEWGNQYSNKTAKHLYRYILSECGIIHRQIGQMVGCSERKVQKSINMSRGLSHDNPVCAEKCKRLIERVKRGELIISNKPVGRDLSLS